MEKMGEVQEDEEIAPTELREQDIEKEGWLYKESRFWKVWRKRWWVLTKKGAKCEGRTLPALNCWLLSFENDNWRKEGKPTEKVRMFSLF